MIQFRYSGHETFSCRYAWLPKAYKAIMHEPSVFSNENEAMVRLGVGKNMVRSIRFWVQLAKVAQPGQGGLHITPFGHAIFSEGGHDPYLEDIKTLWLLHWNFTTQQTEPMFAWHFLFNQWSASDFTVPQIVQAFIAETKKQERSLSAVTLDQHFNVFLHTYYASRIKRASIAEDSLDCPLTELRLIQHSGYRTDPVNKRQIETFTFRRDNKPEITNALLAYCLLDYWQIYRSNEASLSFRDISVLANSVGQVFKLNEIDLRDRLEEINQDAAIPFEFQASAALPRLIKTCDLRDEKVKVHLLRNIYTNVNQLTV